MMQTHENQGEKEMECEMTTLPAETHVLDTLAGRGRG